MGCSIGEAVRQAGLLLVVVLAACAPGLNADAAKHSGLQADGTYVLSDDERWLDCGQLLDRSHAVTRQMQDVSTHAVEKLNSQPSTTVAALGRLIGLPAEEAPEITEYNQLKAEAAALQSAQARKGCVPAKAEEPAPKSKQHQKLHL